MTRKRLGVFVEYFPPRLGGDRRIYELMKNLASDYDIHFFILPPSYTLFIRQIETEQNEAGEFVYENMAGHTLTIPDSLKALWKQSFILSFILTYCYLLVHIMRKMAVVKPDIIVLNNTSVYTGFMGFVCSKVMNKKLVVEYNDLQALYTVELLKDKFGPGLLRFIKIGLVINEDNIVKNGWRVTALTHYIKDYALHRNTRKDIVVIPDGVDTDLFNPENVKDSKIKERYEIEEGTCLCVYAGRIEEAAGANILLETARLLESDNEYKFLIIGEGNPEIFKELKSLSNVIMTGRIPKDDVPSYLASANLVLVPFPPGIASNSISPLKLFEALSMNIPIVASAVNGVKEVVTSEMDVILVPDDPKRWATAVKSLFKKTKHGAGSRNREIVKQLYDWKHLSQMFQEVIEV